MDSQDFGGLRNISVGVAQDPSKQMKFRFILPPGMKIACAKLQAVSDKLIEIMECRRFGGRSFESRLSLPAH